MLLTMHAVTGSQLPNNMRVPGAQAFEGREGHRVCALWLPRLCKWRLNQHIISWLLCDWFSVSSWEDMEAHWLPHQSCRGANCCRHCTFPTDSMG